MTPERLRNVIAATWVGTGAIARAMLGYAGAGFFYRSATSVNQRDAGAWGSRTRSRPSENFTVFRAGKEISEYRMVNFASSQKRRAN